MVLCFTLTVHHKINSNIDARKTEFHNSSIAAASARRGDTSAIFMRSLLTYTLQLCHDYPAEFTFSTIGHSQHRLKLSDVYENATNVSPPTKVDLCVDFVIKWLNKHIDTLELKQRGFNLCIGFLKDTKSVLNEALAGGGMALINTKMGI